MGYSKEKNQQLINIPTFRRNYLKKKKDYYYPIVNMENIKKEPLEDPIFSFEGYDDEHFENVLADNMPRSFNYNHLHYLLKYIQKKDINKVKAFVIGLYEDELFIGIQGFVLGILSNQFKRFKMIHYHKRLNASFYYKAKSLQFLLKDLVINHKDFNFTIYRKYDSQKKIPRYDKLYKSKK